MKSLVHKSPQYWRKLLPLIMILILVNVSQAQEDYHNKPWKPYAKQHSSIVLNNKGEMIVFPQYFNPKASYLGIKIDQSLALPADSLKDFLQYVISIKKDGKQVKDTLAVDAENYVDVDHHFYSKKKASLMIEEINSHPQYVIEHIVNGELSVNDSLRRFIDELNELEAEVKQLKAYQESEKLLKKKIEIKQKKIEAGNISKDDIDNFNDQLFDDELVLKEASRLVKSTEERIEDLKTGVNVFNRFYLTPKTTLYSGPLYFSSKKQARFMRNHYANQAFKEADKLRKEYYEHEELYYLMHNFNGNEKLFKLEPTGEAIKDHKPGWVSDASKAIDGIGTLLDLGISAIDFAKGGDKGLLGGGDTTAVELDPDSLEELYYKEALRRVIEANKKTVKTLGKTIELKEEKRKFELPATVSYTISEYKKPDGEVKKKYTFDKPFKAYNRERFQIQGSLNWDVLGKERIELDPSGTNLNPSLESNKAQFMAGVKYYPWKSEIEDNHFLVGSLHRLSVIGGMSIPKPLENLYLGAAYDIYPGINVNATCLWYQYEEFEVEDGKVIDTDKRYKPSLSMGIGIDASIFVKLIKLLNK